MRPVARLLRTLADRIDYSGAPKRMTTLSVALEPGVGWVLRQDGSGVPIWYYGEPDYDRCDERPVSRVGFTEDFTLVNRLAEHRKQQSSSPADPPV